MKLLGESLVAVSSLLLTSLAGAQQPVCKSTWLPTLGGEPGTNLTVSALGQFDDGTGLGPALYVGGDFWRVGGVLANHVAKWDGSQWAPLGSGLDGRVLAFAVFDDGTGGGPALHVGGIFANAGGLSANYIAKWDGSNWSSLSGGVNGLVSALTVFDDGSGGGPALYVGGYFTSAGGAPAHHIAKWDGSGWAALGRGLAGGFSTAAFELTVFDDGSGNGEALYVGGDFTVAGGVPADHIARWDGSSWSALAGGVDGTVVSLAVFDDGSGGAAALYVGGTFTSAGGVSASRIAKWDGSSWFPLGTGVTGSFQQVRALTVFDDGGAPTLCAGGYFTTAGGIAAKNVAKWNGSNWAPLGNGADLGVSALSAYKDGGGAVLYCGGDLVGTAGYPFIFIARWNGAEWSGLGSGMSDRVHALTVFDDGDGGGPELIVGGGFSSAGGAPASRIVKWNGSRWSKLGNGISGILNSAVVNALTVFDDGSGGGPALYAGGYFTHAENVLASNIAKWDGTTWSSLGSGTNGGVGALAVFDDGSGAGPALYVGGSFTSPASRIAKWDGTGWSQVGQGMDSPVSALAVFDDGTGPALYAGGTFSWGGAPLNHIGKWDGSSWSGVGGGTNGDVSALMVFDVGSPLGPDLYAGGRFTAAGGVPASSIARWNGTSWSSLGSGGPTSGVVTALAAVGDCGPALVAGGNFTLVGGAEEHLARWNGTSWSTLGPNGSGMDGLVTSLAVFDDGSGLGEDLCVGGLFTVSAAGDSYLARWGIPRPPMQSTFCTAKTVLACGPAYIRTSGSPSASATSGFRIEAHPVRACRSGLLLYSNFPIQPATSFGGPGNGLLCLLGVQLARAGPIDSGGTSSLTCDGVLSIDVNRFRALSWVATGCNAPPGQVAPAAFLSNIGSTVNAQMWGRDSIITGQVVSDGVSWDVAP